MRSRARQVPRFHAETAVLLEVLQPNIEAVSRVAARKGVTLVHSFREVAAGDLLIKVTQTSGGPLGATCAHHLRVQVTGEDDDGDPVIRRISVPSEVWDGVAGAVPCDDRV